MAISFDQQLDWVRSGTELFSTTVAGVNDKDLAAPSGLPDWSRAHVVTHVARNADATVNLLTWARTGVETPMYPSREVRDAAIETGARRPPAEVREDLRGAHHKLAEAVAGLPQASWSAPVRTSRGKTIPASEVPWMRNRELWVHVVDLDAGVTFADVPADLLTAIVSDALGWLGAQEPLPLPHLRLEPTDRDHTWDVGSGDGPPVPVSGTAADLAAYVLGRPLRGELRTAGEPTPPPPLPPWI